MPLRLAIRHPAGLAILALSTVAVAAVLALPVLAAWRNATLLFALWGVAFYLIAVAVLHRSRPHWREPEMNALYAVRMAVAERRDEAKRTGNRPELLDILDDTVDRLDNQLLPKLHEVIGNERRVSKHLSRYVHGDLPSPELAVLKRLEGIRERQRKIIHECLQEAANADAALVALLQDTSDPTIVQRVKAWSGELLGIHDALLSVLEPPLPGENENEPPAQPSPANPFPDSSYRAAAPDNILWFTRLTEESLRRMNNPAALGQCELLRCLPLTLEGVLRDEPVTYDAATPLQRAQAFRRVLVLAVERLHPAGASPHEPEALQYQIVQAAYVQEAPNRQIMMRYNVSESTFHRHRRQAIVAIASDLRQQEEQLRRSISSVAGDAGSS